METKICSECGKELLLEMFSKRKEGSKYGYRNKCKQCTYSYQRERSGKSIFVKLTEAEKIEIIKQKYEKNKVHNSEKSKESYYIKNKVKIEENLKQRLIKKDKKLKELNEAKEYYKNNGGHTAKYRKEQRKKINNSIIEKYKDSFEILTSYKNGETKVQIKCLNCGNEELKSGSILNKRRYVCSNCRKIASKDRKREKARAFAKSQGKHRFRVTTESMVNEINILTKYEYTMIGEFTTCDVPILIKHNKCGYEWKIRRGDFISKGCRCPQCYITEKCKELNITIEQWGDSERSDRRLVQRWSNKIKKRDNRKCVICGSNKLLNAHHLNGWHWDIEDRFSIDNGVTLCEECHHKFHDIYGWGGNTKEQFKEYEKPKQLAFAL